jgi:hypothetical protein
MATTTGPQQTDDEALKQSMFAQDMPTDGYNALRLMQMGDPNKPGMINSLGVISALEGHHELEQAKREKAATDSDKPMMMQAPQTAPQMSAPQPQQPSVMGRIGQGVERFGHGLAHAGNIVGSALFPEIAKNVPGSLVYNRDTQERQLAQENVEAERGLKEKTLSNEAQNRQAVLAERTKAEQDLDAYHKLEESRKVAKDTSDAEFKKAKEAFTETQGQFNNAFKEKDFGLASQKLQGQLKYWEAMENRAARDANDKDAQLEVERGKLQVMQYDSALKKAAQDLKGTKEGTDAQLASDKIEQNGTFKRWFGDTSGEAAQATAATTATRAAAPTPELPANFAGAPDPAKGGAKASPYKVGQTVHLKGGKTGVIKAVHSDGSFDLQ